MQCSKLPLIDISLLRSTKYVTRPDGELYSLSKSELLIYPSFGKVKLAERDKLTLIVATMFAR